MDKGESIRAVIVDDDEIDRLSLKTLLEDHPQIEMAGEASALASAIGLIERVRPEVVCVAQILAVTGERIYSRVLVQDGREFLHNRSLREWKELLTERRFKTLRFLLLASFCAHA